MAFLLSTIVSAAIHNDILPRTNDVTFDIHVYWAFNFRYQERTFWISAIEFLPPISTGYVSAALRLRHASGANTLHFSQCVNPHQGRH